MSSTHEMTATSESAESASLRYWRPGRPGSAPPCRARRIRSRRPAGTVPPGSHVPVVLPTASVDVAGAVRRERAVRIHGAGPAARASAQGARMACTRKPTRRVVPGVAVPDLNDVTRRHCVVAVHYGPHMTRRPSLCCCAQPVPRRGGGSARAATDEQSRMPTSRATASSRHRMPAARLAARRRSPPAGSVAHRGTVPQCPGAARRFLAARRTRVRSRRAVDTSAPRS